MTSTAMFGYVCLNLLSTPGKMVRDMLENAPIFICCGVCSFISATAAYSAFDAETTSSIFEYSALPCGVSRTP